MRKVLAVAALSVFVAMNASAVEPVRRGNPRDEPRLVKFIRMVAKTVRNFGDAIVTPRP